MNKYERYLKNRSQKNLRFLLVILLLFVLGLFLSRSFNKNIDAKLSSMDKNIKTTNSKITNVKTDIESIKKDYENRNTDEFKEKLAREKLEMIKKDEYVYKDENNK